MQLNNFKIAPKRPYDKPGPSNPYTATIEVGWDKHDLKVVLPQETAEKILELVADHVVEGCRQQMREFVADAITHSTAPQIEHDGGAHAD